MRIYHYDDKTGLLVGETDAREDPREKGRFLIPRNATDEQPPTPPQGHVVIRENDAWTTRESDIGKPYWEGRAGKEKTADAHIFTLPRNATFTPPPDPEAELVDGVWNVPTEQEKVDKWRSETSVSRFQFVEALRDAGQLQTFIDAANAIGGRDMRAFEQVTEVRRNSSFIEAVRVQVGATQEAVDNLFTAAQAIVE